MSTSNEENNGSNGELPDVVLKALIAQELQEIQEYTNECAKLDEELKEKKHEHDLRKVNIESKQKERKYWKEALHRAQMEEEKLNYEISLMNADLTPICNEMTQELKSKEDHCEKLKNLWEKYKIEWEARPLAIERRGVYKRYLQSKFDLTLLQNQNAYQKKTNRIHREICYKIFQTAVVSFAKHHLERLKLENELQFVSETNAELKSNLALLKTENQSRLQTTNEDYLLMPPPSMCFDKKSMCISDSTSINSIMWEDLLQMDIDSEHSKQTPKLGQEKKPVDSRIKNIENDIQECSSTVNDVIVPYTCTPPSTQHAENENENDVGNEMEVTTSIKSGHFDSYCGCSVRSNSVLDYNVKRGSDLRTSFDCANICNTSQMFLNSEKIEESTKTNKQLNKNKSNLVDAQYNEECISVDLEFQTNENAKVENDSKNSMFDELLSSDSLSMILKDEKMNTDDNKPVVKSIENITNKYQLFSRNFHTDPVTNMFSTKFTPNTSSQKDSATKSPQAARIMKQTKFDEVSIEDENNGEKNKKRAFSPISDIDTDFEMAESMTSNMTYAKEFGNLSPPCGISDLKSENVDPKIKNIGGKKPQESLYSNMQTAGGQLNASNFLGNDKQRFFFG